MHQKIFEQNLTFSKIVSKTKCASAQHLHRVSGVIPSHALLSVRLKDQLSWGFKFHPCSPYLNLMNLSILSILVTIRNITEMTFKASIQKGVEYY